MPFADDGGLVAGGVQQFGHGLLRTIEALRTLS
jgi:hypothetical protein